MTGGPTPLVVEGTVTDALTEVILPRATVTAWITDPGGTRCGRLFRGCGGGFGADHQDYGEDLLPGLFRIVGVPDLGQEGGVAGHGARGGAAPSRRRSSSASTRSTATGASRKQ